MSTLTIDKPRVQETAFTVLFAISFCHLLNDMMQSLLPAIYPQLKSDFHLSFTQIGLVTLAYQAVASLLQPIVGMATDKKSYPHSLSVAMLFTMTKAIVPRYRYDQLMRLGWKVFLPLSLAMVVIVAGVLHFAGLAPK